MGWYQDNFPGSPAQRQRILIGRGLIVYSIVTGGLIYMFSPFARRLRKDFEEGKVLSEWRWFAEKRDIRKIDNRYKTTFEDFLNRRQSDEKVARGDSSGPDISEETIRRNM